MLRAHCIGTELYCETQATGSHSQVDTAIFLRGFRTRLQCRRSAAVLPQKRGCNAP